jgi:hypothetical protein
MKVALAGTSENRISETHVGSELRTPRPDASSVYDLEVLISRLDEGETRGRAANLPLPGSRAATVREALQQVIEQARSLISESLAAERAIPWIDPPAVPEENESRFVVPLVMS